MAIDLNTLKKAEGELNKNSAYSYGCIYKITNANNGMVYVGQTVKSPVWKRIQHHLRPAKRHSVSYIQRAIRAYGTDSFDFEIVAYANSSETLDLLENQFIKEYNSLTPNGYNLVGGGHTNRSVSEQTRETMKAAAKVKDWSYMKGRKPSQEAIDNSAKARKGKKYSAERIEQMRADRTGRRHTSEAKAKVGAFNLGKKYSEERKQNIALGMAKFWIKRVDPKTMEEKIYKCGRDLKVDGFSYVVVFRVISGYKSAKTHKGYQWVKMEKESCR
jgi:group I intron endonuclease